MEMRRDKRGYYFSLDAFFALVLIIAVVTFVKPPTVAQEHETYVHEDLISVLSTLKIGDYDNTHVQELIANKTIVNENVSVLEQLGIFYANDTNNEENVIAQTIINNLDLKENLALYFGDDLIASTTGAAPYGSAQTIETSRYVISGIQNATASTGYASRAFLFSENKVDYFYFGGYVGDGNITAKVTGDIIGARIEGSFSDPFDLYINDIYMSSHDPPSLDPYPIDLSNNLTYFVLGDNEISFRNPDENLYIGGGYIRTTKNSTGVPTTSQIKYFPGVRPLINLYDSFYVPGDLTSLSVQLHYNSTYDMFMSIGNTTVYRGNSSGGDLTVTLDNAYLSGLFDYDEMDEQTIPVRLGLDNVSYVLSEQKYTDVVSVTDLSKSMDCSAAADGGYACFYYSNESDPPGTSWGLDYCEHEDCGFGVWEEPIDAAKSANQLFINTILNLTGNRVGLTGYSGSAPSYWNHDLSADNASLIYEVSTWDPVGGTCICCGINRAKDMLRNQGDIDNNWAIVIMSDGSPNYGCSNFDDYTGSSVSDYVGWQNALDAACNAYENHSITVHTVGLGDGANRTVLESIANCGHGDSYFGTAAQIAEAYINVSEDIIEASYVEQTVIADGVDTILFPDSYISYDYAKNVPLGMVVTAETPAFGSGFSNTTFYIPGNADPYEVRVISYSGAKWTRDVELRNTGTTGWDSVFDLGDYNTTFESLGDPYVVNVPISLIVDGANDVNVSVGISVADRLPGSDNNKVIYSVVKNISTFSPVLTIAEGCNWTIQFEDNAYGTFPVPSTYAGSDECYYNETIPGDHTLYNPNDALEYSVAALLQDIDLNDNGKVEVRFNAEDLTIEQDDLEGIPFTWETEVQTRVWR